jgi:hypothetical protein
MLTTKYTCSFRLVSTMQWSSSQSHVCNDAQASSVRYRSRAEFLYERSSIAVLVYFYSHFMNDAKMYMYRDL